MLDFIFLAEYGNEIYFNGFFDSFNKFIKMINFQFNQFSIIKLQRTYKAIFDS